MAKVFTVSTLERLFPVRVVALSQKHVTEGAPDLLFEVDLDALLHPKELIDVPGPGTPAASDDRGQRCLNA